MSDETKDETKLEPVLEVAAEVAAEAETKPEPTFFDVFDAAPVKPEPPVELERSADEFEGHTIRSNEAGEVFISKDGQCLGVPAGTFKSEADFKDFVVERAKSIVS